jgi:hypothetical protein
MMAFSLLLPVWPYSPLKFQRLALQVSPMWKFQRLALAVSQPRSQLPASAQRRCLQVY